MGKIKLTKTELKAQQEALRQYRRFLPTLQLKKQQLQLEIRLSRERLAENRRAESRLVDKLAAWIGVFADDDMTRLLSEGLRLVRVRRGGLNIAGVMVPTFDGAEFEEPSLDPVATDWYYDESLSALKEAVSLRAAGRIIEEQERLLSRELRVTTQRVNLFEKVKIPECRENIRRIRVQISDQETAAVARSKIAKEKSSEVLI